MIMFHIDDVLGSSFVTCTKTKILYQCYFSIVESACSENNSSLYRYWEDSITYEVRYK